MEDENINKYTQESKYIYLDQAAINISKVIGLEMSERHVERIARILDLSPFKIGNRKAFARGAFEDNFEKFVKQSSLETNTHTQNRVKGAIQFNDKVDAIFTYLEYASSM